MASFAIMAASLPYPFSYNCTMAFPFWAGCNEFRALQWVLSCSTAPDRKVSQPATNTRSPFSINQKQICKQNISHVAIRELFLKQSRRLWEYHSLGMLSIEDTSLSFNFSEISIEKINFGKYWRILKRFLLQIELLSFLNNFHFIDLLVFNLY